MRATRGLLASLGAGTSLMVAGSLMLTLVSTVIAFNGWPGVRSVQAGAVPTKIALAHASRPVRERHGSAIVVHKPAAAPVRHAAAAHHRTPKLTAKSVVTTDDNGAKVPQNAPAVQHAAAPVATKAPPAKKTKSGNPVAAVGDGLGSAVADTGQALGDAVTPASPQLGSLVTNATDVVGGVVKAATGTLGRVLDILQPGVSPTAPAPAAAPQP